MNTQVPSHLSDADLIAQVARLALVERHASTDLIAHLAELDARRLYLGAGFPSTFAYCVHVLRLSEGGAYNRIETARAARKYPLILDLLKQGALNVTTTRLLAPHLTADNHEALLAAASHKSRREVEELVARTAPKPDAPALVRKLPAIQTVPLTEPRVAALVPGDGADARTVPDRLSSLVAPCPPTSSPSTARPPAGPHPVVSPLSADRYRIQFTASTATCEKLRVAQDLLRHVVPNGDPAEIFDRALTALIDEVSRRRFAALKKMPPAIAQLVPRRVAEDPPPGSDSDRNRYIPARVKRAVMARDGGRCAYVARSGHRCGERAFLQFHHVIPFARGGPATVANIQLRCRAHNDYEAELDFRRWSPAGDEGAGRPVAGTTRPETSSEAGRARDLEPTSDTV